MNYSALSLENQQFNLDTQIIKNNNLIKFLATYRATIFWYIVKKECIRN